MTYTPEKCRRMPFPISLVTGKSELMPISDGIRLEGFRDTGTGAWPTTDRAVFLPFELPNPRTFKNIVWFNSTTVQGNIDVGLYTHQGSRVVSLGSTAMVGAGARQVGNITDTPLLPGYYFLAMVWSGTSATFTRYPATSLVLQANGMQEMASAFPLPATATFANPTMSYVPLMWLLTRSVA
jgi:hypothetical protein